MLRFVFLFLSILFFASCSLGVYQPGTLQKIQSRSLSLYEPEFRTCVFDSFYSIVHFPMYHDPPIVDYSTQTYELVAKSQFQLLHTILDYNRSSRSLAVFDEHVTSDSYDLNYIQAIESGLAASDSYEKLNGAVFRYSERHQTARRLFGQGFPSYYEHLNAFQKKFLFDTGASLTLYLLKEIPKIYKVISFENLKIARANLRGGSFNFLDGNENHYWIYTFRDRELRKEVDQFYRKNPSYNGLVFMAYGAKHDFSDDFAGFSFQSGHDFCLRWDSSKLAQP